MNEMVSMKNHILISRGKKRLRLVCHFTSQGLWKCIGCILSLVTYGMKLNNICSEIKITDGKKTPTKLHRDVSGNTDICKVCCGICSSYYFYACY